jgi:phage host-nuclease inhibitor protein Gam
MKSRIKLKMDEALGSREEAEAAMNDLALAMANQRRELAKRDAAVLAINKHHEGNLAAYDQAIQRLTCQLRDWAETSPNEFPKDRKSIQMTSGILGFRTGTPKLALLSRAWTWEKVLNALRNSCMGAGFIRTKEEVDKDGLLGSYSTRSLDAQQLASAGMKVTQDETFYVEPDLTPFETRQTQSVTA